MRRKHVATGGSLWINAVKNEAEKRRQSVDICRRFTALMIYGGIYPTLSRGATCFRRIRGWGPSGHPQQTVPPVNGYLKF